jgi:hypothetical protein
MFNEFSDYLRSGDYESDQFKKGDEINAAMVLLGKRCDSLADALRLFRIATFMTHIDPKWGGPSARMMVDDWLVSQLARGPRAEFAMVNAAAVQLSALYEKRQLALSVELASKPGPRTFYDDDMNRRVAAKMRDFLRWTKRATRNFSEGMMDQKSSINDVRDTLDGEMLLRIIEDVTH